MAFTLVHGAARTAHLHAYGALRRGGALRLQKKLTLAQQSMNYNEQ
jgi:hypothetical protein